MRWPPCSATGQGIKTATGDTSVVLYGKRSPYPYSTRWLDEFDDTALADKLYSSAFPLVDVTVIPDDEIAGHRSMAALTLLQKHIHQRDWQNWLTGWRPFCWPDICLHRR